eukprot:TRINITY_DN605_c0_g1_i2.p2 TRINITY_DN605_c0_g1~~TRINITY_DN605_c0_g1_i2.p2  ORF type:complete len:663 (+),score=76.01 TRINITY_DN605_c0_g1_i2:4061-6049(+)
MAQFEEAAGIARILEVVNFWIESLRKTAYKEAKYGDFAGLKWALITLFEGSDILVNKNDDIKLATFKTMRNLFDMINYIHSVVHESEPPEPKLIPNKKEKYLLGSILNITLYDKSEGTAYTESSVEELIQSKSDMRIYSILLQVAELTLLLMNELAQYYSMQEPLALSGWSWIGLYHALCCDSPNYLYLKNFFETEQLQILSLAITRYSCGFSLKMKGSIDVFDTFEPTLSKLMSKHVFNQLVSGIEIVGLRIKEPPVTEVLVMLRQILEKLNKEIEHPNFLWTKESHNELKAALRDHLATVFKMPEMTKDNFMGKLVNFEYKSYEGEIMIDSVFVRVINKDPYMPLDNVAEFFKAALIELSKVNPLEKDERLLHKTLMIVEALDNVAVYQKGIEQIGLSMDHVEILLKFVTPPAITLRPGLEIIRSHVFSIFVEASKESKCVSTMLQNPDFTLAVLYHLCNIPNTPVAHLTLTIVQGLSRHSNATGALIAYGYVIGLLAIAFDDNIDKKYRTKAVEILVKVLIQGKSEPKHNILNDYVPHYILEQLTERWSKEAEEVLYFIDHDHRDAYIIWNSVLRARTKEILKDEAKKISVTIEKGYKIPWADMKKEYSINKYVNEGEVVVEGVVLSNFIKFPAIKLKVGIYYLIIIIETAKQILGEPQ